MVLVKKDVIPCHTQPFGNRDDFLKVIPPGTPGMVVELSSFAETSIVFFAFPNYRSL